MLAAKQQQRLVVEHEALLVLVNSLSENVFFVDADRKVVLVNDAVRASLGLSDNADIHGRLSEAEARFEVFTPDGRKRLPSESPFVPALKGEAVQGEELVRNVATGEMRHRRYEVSPVRLGGKVVGAVSVVRDITERKRAEKALRESQHRLVAALEIAALSVWEYRPDAGLVEFDERCSEMFGMGDRRAMNIEEFLAFVHEEDRLRVAADVRAALDPEGGGLYNTEYRIIRPDGVQRWLAARGHAIFTRDGNKRRLGRSVGTIMDITERKEAEEALKSACPTGRRTRGRVRKGRPSSVSETVAVPLPRARLRAGSHHDGPTSGPPSLPRLPGPDAPPHPGDPAGLDSLRHVHPRRGR